MADPESAADALLDLAWQFVEETDANVFLTGRAGTGKTTFLRRLQEKCPKRMVVAAPTGVAAVSAGGMTLHSFFQLPLAPFIPGAEYRNQRRYAMPKVKKGIIRSMDLLVIDEISMVRADLLDAVDDALRRYRDPSKPFGGVQLLLIGDLQQLPPVVTREEEELFQAHYATPFFFSARSLDGLELTTIELQKVYRQSSDPEFLGLLNDIREGGARGEAALERLNRRVVPGFVAPEGEGFIRLTSHNALADSFNARALAELPGDGTTYKADISGDFPASSQPTDAVLVLKRGAQVMFVKNDQGAERRFYNGLIGTVVGTGANGVRVKVPEREEPIDVEPLAWENKKYTLDAETKAITEQVQGTFKQLPLRLAWAVTIHKSQGLTFDHVIIDAARAFAHGQVYVALSRCRTLAGIVLTSPIGGRTLVSDAAVGEFLARAQGAAGGGEEALAALLPQLRERYHRRLLQDLFNFAELEKCVALAAWGLREFFGKTYPALARQASAGLDAFRQDITGPAEKFCALIEAKPYEHVVSGGFQARIAAGAAYFQEHLAADVEPWRSEAMAAETDSKEHAQRFLRMMGELVAALHVKQALLKYAGGRGATAPFKVPEYLAVRLEAMLQTIDGPAGRSARKRGRTWPGGATAATRDGGDGTFLLPGTAVVVPGADMAHPGLLSLLRSWRSKKAKELHLPAYCVLGQKAMHAIANGLPLTSAALANTPHFGARSFEHYAAELLPIIRAYAAERGLLAPLDCADPPPPSTLF